MTAPVKLMADHAPLVILDGVIVAYPAERPDCLRDFAARMPRAALPPTLECEPFGLLSKPAAEQDLWP